MLRLNTVCNIRQQPVISLVYFCAIMRLKYLGPLLLSLVCIQILQNLSTMNMNTGVSDLHVFSSPEPKAQGELIVWDSSRRRSVRPFTLSNKNISETSWPIIIKFHQKHHWGGGLTALGFQLERIRTLVSMATYSSHRVIMGKIL